MKAKIYVTLKEGVLDPQGKAVLQALNSLGFDSACEVRQGKYFEIELATKSKSEVQNDVQAMCEKLLANTVIENYRFEVIE